MDYEELLALRDEYLRKKERIPEEILKELDFEFRVKFTYDSVGLSGNTLTKDEVREIIRQCDAEDFDLTMK